jgi:hypothetical protein
MKGFSKELNRKKRKRRDKKKWSSKQGRGTIK